MSKIFAEIKKAIEEEMRNAEGQPPPGQRREGGRRAQEYAEWLKQEQERLRGGSQSQTQDAATVESGPLTEQQWERRGEEEWREWPSQQGERERPRSSDRQQRERSRQSGDQRTSADYWQQSTAGGHRLQRQVHNLLRSPQGMRQAFVLREIVSKPVSLRNKDEHLIS